MFNLVKFRLIDFYTKTNVIDAYREACESEWYSRATVIFIQQQKLKELLIHSYNKSEYFTDLFKKYNFNPTELTESSELEKIPIQTKKDYRINFEKVKTTDYEKYRPRKNRTSGSTGEPFEIYHTDKTHSLLRALNYAAWHQTGYNLGDRFATFSGGSLLPGKIGLKMRVYMYLQNSIPLPSYHLSKEKFNKYLKILQRSKVKYIFGYASALYDFAKTVEEEKLDFSFVKGIFSTSDMLFPNQRSLIEKVFGTKVIDIYGNPESGLISYECNQHDGYHYGMLNSFVEIVDEEGNNVKEGTQGRIVATSLNNKAFPIIRYDTGDIGSLSSEKCSCGRGLLKIKELGGRSRDYIILQDGRHIHGAFFNHLENTYKSDWLERYHIIQTSKEELTFQCLTNRKPTEEELNKIKSEIALGTNNLLNIDMQIVDQLPLTKMGKYKLIQREFDEV